MRVFNEYVSAENKLLKGIQCRHCKCLLHGNSSRDWGCCVKFLCLLKERNFFYASCWRFHSNLIKSKKKLNRILRKIGISFRFKPYSDDSRWADGTELNW